MFDKGVVPIKIKLIKNTDQVHFYYEGGRCLILDSSFIRAVSPSAENKIHSKNPNPEKFKDIKVIKIEKVGNYALKFHFSDNHNTGIFSWDYILKIAQLSKY